MSCFERHVHASRGISVVLIAGQLLVGVPVGAQQRASASMAANALISPPPPAPKVTVNRTVPKVEPPSLEPRFSAAPTVEEIFRARVFNEPLVPVGGEPTPDENLALANAMLALHRQGNLAWDSTIGEFLRTYADSPWRASLLANLGVVHARAHAYSRALEAWDSAWNLTKDLTDRRARAVADFALTEWLTLATSFGQLSRVEERLASVRDREIGGTAGVKISSVRETAALIERHTDRVSPCGPEAVFELLIARSGAATTKPDVLASYRTTAAGTSLSELQKLAQQVGLSLRMVSRTGAVAIPTPSIVHLKVGHYVAVVERKGEQYRIVDRTRAEAYWVSGDTLKAESSGYFLIPTEAQMDDWRPVDESEADEIRGFGPLCPDGAPPPAPPEDDADTPCPNKGMAGYSLQGVTASLIIRDTPAGYAPPRGPAVDLTVSYHHREALQPQIFSIGNMGPKWTFNWVRFVQEEPMDLGGTPAHVWVALPPGGREVYVNPDAQGVYPAHWHSRAILVRVSNSPLRYERRLPDGTVEVYAQSDGAPAGQRQVFLTEFIDPQGQELQFTWDAQLRVVAITDAIGQVSTVEYLLPADPLKITAVVDPFGRRAAFEYNAAGQLISITDAIGLKSEFAYSTNDFITTLTTPYGVTSFRHEPDALNAINFRYIEATDPLGGTEHLEFQYDTPSLPAALPPAQVPAGFTTWNEHLNRYNTFYWSKRAWAEGAGDLSKAVVTHWMVAPEWQGWQIYSYVPHSIKDPLEGRVWYAYPGQVAGNEDQLGWFARASRVGRMLDDGTSQIYEVSYNTQGRIQTQTDPLGRQTTLSYAPNGVDLIDVRQTTAGANDLLATLGNYNGFHEPQTVSDAAGQTTTVTYNSAGQPLTITNARQETTTYGYDTTGYLTTITGAMSGAVVTVTYDGYGRSRTLTQPDGYVLTTDYDLFDRPTRVTYPDGTFAEATYSRLDLATTRDRLGRVTRYYVDALRRVTAIRDPLGRTVTQEWCGCGSLEALVDPNGNRTRWERDLQGRVTREVRANGSATRYVYEPSTSRLLQRTDAKNQTTTYQYFADDSLKQMDYANAAIATPSIALTYDAAYGRLASMTDGIGTTSYTYRPVAALGAGHLSTVDGPLANDTITYGYDELGRVVSRTLNGVTSTSTFDPLGRLSAQADPIGTFTYAYDGVTRRLQQLTYPNGQTSTYTYYGNAGDRRLQDIHHQTSGGATLSRFSYTYDTVGNIGTWMQQYEASVTAYDFTYDPADQLKDAVYRTTGSTPTVLKRYGYAYDAVGNRTGVQVDDAPTTWAYDGMNRATAQIAGGALRFEGTVSEPAAVTIQGRPAFVDAANRFSGLATVIAGTTTVPVTASDASGNTRSQSYEVDVTAADGVLTYDANGDLSSQGTKTYEWNARDELVGVLHDGLEIARFAYDGFGRRTEKTAGGVTREYVYDGEDIVEERTSAGTSRHVHGPGIDQPLATVDPAGTVSYYLADHLGSIVQTTNAAAQVVLTRRYDPFGNQTTGTGVGGYAFTGREWDTETGLYYYRARYLDASASRFLSEDPSGFAGGINQYAYVEGNPVGFVDPDGLELVPVSLPGLGNTYLDSAFLPAVQAFIEAARARGVEPDFNSAYRPPEVQQALRDDPSAVTPAKVSLHSAGYAVDVNYDALSASERKSLLDAAEEAGLDWGGKFKHPDRPHFYNDPLPQKPGESISDWRARRQKLVDDATKRYKELTSLRKAPKSCN